MDVIQLGEFCRFVENYLGRKNAGPVIHLIGPRFELVQGWFARGIPLSIVTQGIDRVFERRQSKKESRRPVLIEFCEADVLDVFDAWKRAIGVVEAGGAGEADEAGDADGASRGSLPAHLDRVIARLTTLRGGSDRTLDPVLEAIVRELDAARAKAKTIRGEAREALLDRLRQLDASLTDAVRRCAGDETLQQMAAEADDELKPFKARMPAEAYQQSHRACIDRLLRDRAGLPAISYG
jgi:hypothetical protein